MNVDVTKLKFLSGSLREDRQGTYDYISLLKQGLTALGVTYPSSGGGGAGWNSDETMTANRTKTMDGFRINIQGNNTSTNPVMLEFSNEETSSNFNNIHFRQNPAFPYNTGGFKSAPVDYFYASYPNGDGTSNNVWGIGANRDNVDTDRHGWSIRVEDDWLTGGARYTEFHMANLQLTGAPSECRLLSGTFVRRSTYALSDMTWDFRATVYNFMNLVDQSSLVISDNSVSVISNSSLGYDSPILYVRDDANPLYQTYLQQNALDAVFSGQRNMTISARQAGGPWELNISNMYINVANSGINSLFYTWRTKAGDPTTSEVPSTAWQVWKNTTSGDVKLWVNDSGVLKSVTLT